MNVKVQLPRLKKVCMSKQGAKTNSIVFSHIEGNYTIIHYKCIPPKQSVTPAN